MYVRDAWYMAGWNKDFAPATPRAETILEEPIVLYRKPDGGIVALEDRCVHRLAPLSLGRCEGENLRCMYHGLKFAPDGRCIEIPGQDMIPPQARVRSYPAAERHSAVWLWLGDPARADTGLIPDFVGYETAEWPILPGRLDYAAPARLIHDNLLDLSHIAYVHANSFAGGSSAVAKGWLDADIRTTALPRGVRVERWIENMPVNPAGGTETRPDGVDVWTRYDFLVPGIFLQLTERHPRGACARAAGGRPPEGGSIFSTFTCQAVTPLTADTACYFFAYGPWAKDAARAQFFADLGMRAFNEDRVMIEAQHRILQATPGHRMLPLAMDKAVKTYEGVVKRLLRAEAGGGAADEVREPVHAV